MQRKHIISLCILLCALAVLVAFRPSADETVPLTGSASAGLILLDGQSGGYYVLAVIDQSRADRAGIAAGFHLKAALLRAGREQLFNGTHPAIPFRLPAQPDS